MLPRPNRVAAEPTPDGAVTDGGDQPELPRLLCHIGHAEARQGRAQRRRQFTRECLDLYDHLWGEGPGPAWACLILPPGQAFSAEPLSPQVCQLSAAT